MEMYSIGLEVRALRTVTSSKIKDPVRMAMLGRLSKEHFSSEVTRKAYRRLSKLVEVRGQILEWSDLLEDPNLGEDFRDALEEQDVDPAKGMKGFERIYEQLEAYRKRRTLMQMAKEIHKTLDADDNEEFDEDEYLNEVAEGLGKVKSTDVTNEKVWSFGGKNANALELAEKTINSPTETLYLTGFEEYDRRNGGIPTTGVMLLAGSTSGGKSVMAQNLSDNLAKLNGLHSLTITLEMTAEQHMNRHLSMISGVEFAKIKKKELSDREKKRLLEAATKYNKEMTKAGARVSFTSPERGMTMDDVLYMTIPYGADVCVLDYVGLLEGMDEDNQWRMLSGAVRQAKIHTQRTGKLFIILVQFDSDSNKIRYARGMKEHADVLWQWNYSDPEVRETRVLPVQIAKVRDGELFEMALEERFDIMRVGSAPEGTEVPKSKSKSLGLDDFKGKGKGKKKNPGREAAKKFLSSEEPQEHKKSKKKKRSYVVS